MSNEELRAELNAPQYTEKELRLAQLLEPNPEHAPKGKGMDSVKGLWSYEFFSMYYIHTRDIVEDDTPGWLPHYTTRDMRAALQAEGALPEDKRDDYLRVLCALIGVNYARRLLDGGWALRRATPEQMVDAMLAVLEPQLELA